MEENKILILTLGTGNRRAQPDIDLENPQEDAQTKHKKFEEFYRKGEYVYGKKTYVLNGKETQSEFVASILVEDFKPDTILIFGTVKSSWIGIFSKFHSNDENEVEYARLLYDVEHNYGIHTDVEQLRELEKRITEIFGKAGVLHDEDKNYHPRVRVFLTRYGISEQELVENYGIVKKLEQYLCPDRFNRIAFDITHSFRSLPIFHLIVLNFFKNLKDYPISIDHIYYGCIEVEQENNHLAPVVDLASLANVLNLTNGTLEFRNTGNATTLLTQLSDGDVEKKKFVETLKKFDWAIHVNDLGQLISAISELTSVCETSTGTNAYDDIQVMLRDALTVNFGSEFQQIPAWKQQYRICKWYYQQHQYGVALATGLEALRSCMMEIYKKYKVTASDDENTRKNAVDRLRLLTEADIAEAGFDASETEVYQYIKKLESCRIEAVGIRNIFAHNLNGTLMGCQQPSLENQEEKIADFFAQLDRLVDILDKSELMERFLKVYSHDIAKKGSKEVLGENERVRLILSGRPLSSQELAAIPVESERSYRVYVLPEKYMEYLEKDKKSKSGRNAVQNAEALRRAIEEKFSPTTNVQLIYYKLGLRNVMVYSTVLDGFPGEIKLLELDPIANSNQPELQKLYKLPCLIDGRISMKKAGIAAGYGEELDKNHETMLADLIGDTNGFQLKNIGEDSNVTEKRSEGT